MTTTQEIIKLSLHDAFVKTLMKVRSLNVILSDMYVQILEEEENTTVTIYDDADNEILKSAVDGWDEWKESIGNGDITDAAIGLFTDVVFNTDLLDLFNDMEYNGPFSLLLVDKNMEVISEILTIDNENIVIGDEFWEKMDKELDEFYEKLMSDIRTK